jgi:hypothetical protein
VASALGQGTAALAIPTFGTMMPKAGQWQAGGRADIILKRTVEDYRRASSAAYYYKCSFGFADWFCFDGLIGIGSVESERNTMKDLRYPANFSGGYGWRAKLYEGQGFSWAFGFQHVSTHPGKRRQVQGRKYEIIWDDWQLSTTVSKDIGRIRPYCGMKWSYVYLIDKIDGDRHRRLSSGSPIGLVAGTDLKITDYLYLNAEGRFFDETALNAGFTVSY